MNLGLDHEATAWMSQALCAQIDMEMFFPEHGENSTAARKVCMACPVRLKCLNYAIDNFIRDGIWGGTNRVERDRMKRQKRRAA